MSILRQQRRLWFLAGASTGALGLFILEKEAAEGFGRIAAQLPGAHAPPAIKVRPDQNTNVVINTCMFVGQARIEKRGFSVQLASVQPASTEPAPIFGQQFWAMAARRWNLGVDAVFQPIVHQLSKRGW